MPSYNKVMEAVSTGSVVHGGKQLIIEIATLTSLWQRPSDIARNAHGGFARSMVQYPGKLPKGTTKLIVRELAHESLSEWRSHYTVGAVDKKGNWTTVHVHAQDPPKEDKKVDKKVGDKKKDKK